MNIKNKKVKHCLLCKNKKIKKIFSLGNLFVSNFVEKKNIKKGIKAPLNLLYCHRCSLIQLSHIAPQQVMYKRFYWYRSGITKTMRLALQNFFKESLKYVKLNVNDVVLPEGVKDDSQDEWIDQIPDRPECRFCIRALYVFHHQAVGLVWRCEHASRHRAQHLG